MLFDRDYAINMLHNTPIAFSYDGNGNYIISQKDMAVLLEHQHKATVKLISSDINKLIEKDKSCIGIGYAKTCKSIVDKDLKEKQVYGKCGVC